MPTAKIKDPSSQSLFATDPAPSGRVLCIGGSDPSGAAGIQADLKTLTALGAYGCTALTAVTVQNQHGVSDVVALPGSVVGAQIDAALSDAPCAAIKTGMLASLDAVYAVSARARSFGSSTQVIVDPVLCSSSGRRLLASEAVAALIKELIPLSALVTPNLSEAIELTGRTPKSREDLHFLADHFLAMGAAAVLIKGGHPLGAAADEALVSDLLRTADGEHAWFERSRVPEPEFRGTGCALASAVAAGVAEGLTLHASVARGIDYITYAMQRPAPYGAVRALAHHLPSHPFETPGPGH